MAVNPSFISTPRLATATVSTANLHAPGGSITSIISGVDDGTKVLELVAKINLNGASTAAALVVWITTDNAATWLHFDEMLLAAATASASVATTRNTLTWQNLVLVGSTHQLGVSTTVAQSTTVTVMAGDLT